MTLYLDTSVLVAALVPEAATQRVQSWLAAQDADALVTSDWTVTEFSSALSIKMRAGKIGAGQRAAALAALAKIAAQSLEMLAIGARDFAAAARLADHDVLGLRAGDALHLAVASAHGATIVTLDRKFAAAAEPLGVGVLLM